MKIDYLSFSKIPSRDANSVHVMNMCHAFSQNGHNVRLHAKKYGKSHKSYYEYYGVSSSFELCLSPFPRVRIIGDIIYGLDVLRKLILSTPPSLYFGRHPHLLWLMSFRNVPIILDSHDVPQSWTERNIQSLIFRSKNFKRLIVTSEISKSEYLKLFPSLSSAKIVVARNGANLNNDDITDLINWPGRATHLQVGYAGNIYPGRGIDIIYSMAQSLPDIDFHIVGGNETDVKKWYNEQRPPNIYFHGHVPHKKVSSYLNKFDIVLAPYQRKVTIGGGKGDTSRWMCPLKIFDYMASRKVIIASNLLALKEILEDGVNALLVTPDDPNEWVYALKKLQSNPEMRSRLASNAYEECRLNYTWDKRANRVLKNLSL